MEKINQSVKLILALEKTQSILTKRFDGRLGGMSLSEFTILYALSTALDASLRRIDLAQKSGMTASGITRILLPMEKVGLIKSGETDEDARIRLVILTSRGRRKLHQAIERLELLLKEMLPFTKTEKVKELTDFLALLGGQALL
jgi:DNA-binding MarR family transcriptional regulator